MLESLIWSQCIKNNLVEEIIALKINLPILNDYSLFMGWKYPEPSIEC